MWSAKVAATRRFAILSWSQRDGPAMATLGAAAIRTACLVRAMGMGLSAILLVIWAPWYGSDAARLLAPAMAVVWNLVLIQHLMDRQFVRRLPLMPLVPLAVVDTVVQIAFLLGAAWWVPPAIRGDASNWLFVAVPGQFLLQLWCVPVTLGLPLVLGEVGAYLAGASIRSPWAVGRGPGAAAAMLASIALVATVGRLLLERRALQEDAGLAAADANERDELVALAVAWERREQERLLHDTVLNTLTALARGTRDGGELIRRCRHDVALIEQALAPPDAAGSGGATPTDGGLLAGIEAIVAEMHGNGLSVHVDVSAPGTISDASSAAATLPVTAAVALVRAVREALTNVVRHAGTDQAWVRVVRANAVPAHTSDGPSEASAAETVVVVRDAGAGFDPAAIEASRLGVRRSVIERVEDCGGEARVQSAKGEGTTVTLRWPRPGPGTPGLDERGGLPLRSDIAASEGVAGA